MSLPNENERTKDGFWKTVERLSAELVSGAIDPASRDDLDATSAAALAAKPSGIQVEPGCAAAHPPRLESLDSNLNQPRTGAVVPCKCRCRTCAKCGKKLGWRVRQNLIDKADKFWRPAMLTLTVDRSHFENPEQAHGKITTGGFIPRLMRLLGIRTWFWVLEFQTKSGSGWPHWHIVVDLSACPDDRLDLARAWRLWRDKWGLGGLDLKIKRNAADAYHAIMYVTKYLTKMPEAFPLWVLERRSKGIRFIGGCKALGSLTGEPSRAKPEEEEESETPDKSRDQRASLICRMARCDQRSNIFAIKGDGEEAVWKFLKQLDASPDDLRELSDSGCTSVRLEPIACGNRKLLGIRPGTPGWIGNVLWSLKAELEDREVGHGDYWRLRMAERERKMLALHEAFWRRRAA